MAVSQSSMRYNSAITLLLILMLILGVRLAYLYLADHERFPINTVKVVSMQKYMTHNDLDAILEKYWKDSFFSLPIGRLQAELSALSFIEKAEVERIWPDILKINLFEKVAIAYWNHALLTENASIFDVGRGIVDNELPHLSGPENKQQEVLQIYKKMSKILSKYGLRARTLDWRENLSWDLVLTNGLQLRLGKQDLETRISRFCKAYPAVFGEHPEQLVMVDLRYPRGMAVEWKK